jgi:flavoprotein
MPLDARKAAHVQNVVLKKFTGRTSTVVFVYQSGSSYSYVATSVLFRKQEVIDPQIPDIGGNAPRLRADALMIAPITTNFTCLVYIANTSTATAGAVQNAEKFQIIEAVPTGIVPGGTHWVCPMRRLR